MEQSLSHQARREVLQQVVPQYREASSSQKRTLLAWACFHCNRFKGSDLASVDPLSGKIVFLFNPREQRWSRHFRLNGGRTEGITASGRATVALLHLNDAERVAYRLGLVALSHYPPR